MQRLPTCLALACATALLPSLSYAATYTVGPSGRNYTQLSTLVDNVDLQPGDIVLVDGGTSYNGNVLVRSGDGGSAGNPVTFRWNRAVGATRPVLLGGSHTIKFQQSNHVVFEGFDVRGGTTSCIFSEAHDVTVRDSIVRDCPSHGILGADNNSGSFTLEYSEVFNSGSGTNRHSIYMQSDEVAYPGAVFLMRYNYIHDGNGGSLLKNRHERALIYYNWFENSAYQELELIGPDCNTQQSGWTPSLKREDVDLVGNVIVHTTSNWRHAIRAGGDLDGASQGRLRMVNNSIIFNRPGTANAVLVQLGLESLEMHNNVVYQTGSGAAPTILRVHEPSEVDTPECDPINREPWKSGRKVAGSNNWVQSSATLVPTEWTGTLRGGDPRLANAAQFQFRPLADSALLSSGNPQPSTPSAFPFPSPLLLPAFDPPQRAKMAMGAQTARAYGARIDIGAFESAATTPPPPQAPVLRNGSRPLVPGVGVGGAGRVTVPAAGQATVAPPTVPRAGGARVAPSAKASAAGEDFRVEPPALFLWARLRDWFERVQEGDLRQFD